MITLEKKTGINLKKGSSIKLEKNGLQLQRICIGLNWGAITKTGFLRTISGTSKVAVDLDGAVSLFSNNYITETIYFRKLMSDNRSVLHSGDDLTGDLNGDDGLDNETITINLETVGDHIDTIYIFLNSYKGQDFGDIPYSKLRIFEGTPSNVQEVLATFNLSVEEKFNGYVSMVMGKLIKTGGNWDFVAIGEPVPQRSIGDIASHLQSQLIRNAAF